MTIQPHAAIGGGHLTNTADPGWCVYCGLEIPPPPPPPWDWASARQAVIVRAAETARRQWEARVRQARAVAARRRIDTAVARTATWTDIIRRITAA